MNEIKPIVVIYYLKESLSPTTSIREVNEMMMERFPDYHTLAVPSRMSLDGSCEDLRLEVFHPKDFTEIQFEALKVKVLEEIKNKNNNY